MAAIVWVRARDLKPGDAVLHPSPEGLRMEVLHLEEGAHGAVHVRWTDENLLICDQNHSFPRAE